MQANDLERIFKALESPSDRVTLSAERIRPGSRYRIARDAQGNAALLCDHPEAKTASNARPIRLQHFEYEPRISASVSQDGSKEGAEGTFLFLSCPDADDEMRSHFFELITTLIEQLGEAPAFELADRSIRKLVELFRAMAAPAQRTIAGLWGELLLIANAADVSTAAAAWHSNPNADFDFAMGEDRVEVKTTTRMVREHEVALGQLSGGRSVLLVSILAEQSDVGLSVEDLLHLAQSRLPPANEARERLSAICFDTIGQDWAQTRDVRFDSSAALESIRWFEGDAVPSVDRNIPPQVSRVRFMVDLSDSESMSPSEACQLSPLAGALVPTSDVE